MSAESSGTTYGKVALVLEGGGTRSSYTAPFMVRFLKEEIGFGWVGGASAGAAHMVNYLSGSLERTRDSFVDFIGDPRVGGFRSLVRGRGFLNGQYIYEEATAEDGPLPFDWQTFKNSQAQFRIGAVRAETGETVYWSRDDIEGREDLLAKLRASSSLPGAMILPEIDGSHYVDGAVGSSGGVALEAAEMDGYERFLVLRTRPRNFVRKPVGYDRVVRGLFRNYPEVANLLQTRHERYNTTRERLLDMERYGRAKLVFADDAPVSNSELDVKNSASPIA